MANMGAQNEANRTGYRWTICALIFFATTVNYLDRQLFSILVPFFEDDLKLGPTDLALINVSFILPYGLSMMFIGRWIDRFGIKRGLGIAFWVWNLACAAHALVRSLPGFMGARFLLGVGEASMFPAAVKTMAEWFPPKERALATGYFNAGANLGALLAPLLGVALATHFGWRACFVVVGLLGLVWVVFWQRMYAPPDEHKKVSADELAHIHSDAVAAEPPLTYGQLFSIKPIFGLILVKALSDAPWWFYLTWVPKFLIDQFKLTPTFMAIAVPVIYIVADVGSIAGGWMSSRLISRGVPLDKARKLTLLACACAVLPVASVGWMVDVPTLAGIPSVYWAVGIIAIAAGAHQGWSSNFFTVISDTVPKSGIATAVGVINGFGMVGASAMQFVTGRSVQVSGNYIVPFLLASVLYLVSLAVLQIFLPTVKAHRPGTPARMPIVVAAGLAILAALGWLQFTMNKPPYASFEDYKAKRAAELGATLSAEEDGAKVGWMRATWITWQPTGKPIKRELVKFDQAGRPFIEGKGAKAPKYVAPR